MVGRVICFGQQERLGITMNRLWLKIVGCVVVVSVAVLAVYIFWPAASPIAESKDAEQVQEPTEAKPLRGKLPRLGPERTAGLHQSKTPQTTEFEELNPAQESLYRDTSFRDGAGRDVRSGTPSRPKFIKSRRLRRRLSRRLDKEFDLNDEEMRSSDQNSP